MQNFSAEGAYEIRGRPKEPLDGVALERSPAVVRGLGARWPCPTTQFDQLEAGVGAPGVGWTTREVLFPGGGR